MKSPILGGFNVSRSLNAAANALVNLYPEVLGEGGKEASALFRCPGLRLLATAGGGPVRGAHQFGGFGYVVSGGGLYQIGPAWSATLLGAISGSGPVSMADNGTQLFIAANPDGYIYNATTGVFAQITDTDFAGAVTVGYLDGFFVFNQTGTQIFWATSLLDGTAVDPLDFASAEGSPDRLLALRVDHQEVWLFGQNSIEIWASSGGADFPFERIRGAVMEIGCMAAYSIAKLDNTLFWLGSDDRGTGIVYRANGYSGVRVSTHPLETAIAGYGDVSDAIAYSYQQQGHSFYVLIFPAAGKTWAFDMATQLWHERANFVGGAFGRHRSNCFMSFGNEIVVGDYETGNLYALDLNVHDDNGGTQKWVRSWRAIPAGQNNLKRTAHHSLQLDCEVGIGLDGAVQGTDPQVMLRWSDDGGHTWSNTHTRSMGRIGQTGRRVIWNRLGMTSKLRDRVYEISGTDPVRIAITGAHINMDGTTS